MVQHLQAVLVLLLVLLRRSRSRPPLRLQPFDQRTHPLQPFRQLDHARFQLPVRQQPGVGRWRGVLLRQQQHGK